MEFAYCTIRMLRDEDVTTDELSDARAIRLIRLVSLIINRVTNQWFCPVVARMRVSGRGTPIVHMDNMVPIVQLDKVEFALPHEDTGTEFPLTGLAFRPGDRIVQRLASDTGMTLAQRVSAGIVSPQARANFPANPYSVILDGVFGWLENLKYVETTVTAQVSSGAILIPVASVEGWRVGDVAVFAGAGNETAMVSAVHASPPKIEVDPIEFSIPAGSVVATFGRVPLEIQEACKMLVIDKLEKLSEEVSEEADIAERITSESTEGYSYSLSPKPVGEKLTGSLNTTGNGKVDTILSNFVAQVLYVGYA